MFALDHLAISARSLDEGAAWVEAQLGLVPGGGGEHPLMGTHNRLMAAGDVYLEVIAVAPHLPRPGRARWFDLDRFDGPPRLSSWVIRTEDMQSALALAPAGIGQPIAVTRGDLRWEITLPEDGRLPFDGLFPALIRWEGVAHPVQRLGETGVALRRLELRHPEAPALAAALAPFLTDDRVVVQPGLPSMIAHFDTPAGMRVLGVLA